MHKFWCLKWWRYDDSIFVLPCSVLARLTGSRRQVKGAKSRKYQNFWARRYEYINFFSLFLFSRQPHFVNFFFVLFVLCTFLKLFPIQFFPLFDAVFFSRLHRKLPPNQSLKFFYWCVYILSVGIFLFESCSFADWMRTSLWLHVCSSGGSLTKCLYSSSSKIYTIASRIASSYRSTA